MTMKSSQERFYAHKLQRIESRKAFWKHAQTALGKLAVVGMVFGVITGLFGGWCAVLALNNLRDDVAALKSRTVAWTPQSTYFSITNGTIFCPLNK